MHQWDKLQDILEGRLIFSFTARSICPRYDLFTLNVQKYRLTVMSAFSSTKNYYCPVLVLSCLLRQCLLIIKGHLTVILEEY